MSYCCKKSLLYTTSRALQGWKWFRWPRESGPLESLLVGQVGLICKLNYLDMTRISHVLRKTVLASGKWVNFGSDEYMHWNIIGAKQAYFYLKPFWSMWCPKISSSSSLCKRPVLYPAKNEEIYGIVSYQKFFMSCYISYF